jgi:hypothetical protein
MRVVGDSFLNSKRPASLYSIQILNISGKTEGKFLFFHIPPLPCNVSYIVKVCPNTDSKSIICVCIYTPLVQPIALTKSNSCQPTHRSRRPATQQTHPATRPTTSAPDPLPLSTRVRQGAAASLEWWRRLSATGGAESWERFRGRRCVEGWWRTVVGEVLGLQRSTVREARRQQRTEEAVGGGLALLRFCCDCDHRSRYRGADPFYGDC